MEEEPINQPEKLDVLPEDTSSQLPTEESSVFQEKHVALASEMFADYVRAEKSEIRRRILDNIIKEFDIDHEKKVIIARTWAKMAQGSDRKNEFDLLNEKVFGSLEKKSVIENKMILESATNPENIKDLPLILQYIRKSAEEELPRYAENFSFQNSELVILPQKKIARLLSNQFMLDAHPAIIELCALCKIEKWDDSIVAVISGVKGDKNIYMSQERLENKLLNSREEKSDPRINICDSALDIVHELFHRATKEEICTSNIEKENIKSLILQKRISNNFSGVVNEDEIKNLLTVMHNIPPERMEISFKGAMVNLRVDGKKVSLIGRNLEEYVNDLINPGIRIKVFQKVAKLYNFNPNFIKFFTNECNAEDFLTGYKEKADDLDLEKVKNILQDLGLSSKDQIIDAFLNSKIPRMYFQKYPNGKYFF